jgi:hypothetical protein
MNRKSREVLSDWIETLVLRAKDKQRKEVTMRTIYGRDGIRLEEPIPDEPDQEILFWQD